MLSLRPFALVFILAAAPSCAADPPPGCSPLVAHRRCDTPAELRARCRWASKRAAQQHHHRDGGAA